jgi:hypothetical protein
VLSGVPFSAESCADTLCSLLSRWTARRGRGQCNGSEYACRIAAGSPFHACR